MLTCLQSFESFFTFFKEDINLRDTNPSLFFLMCFSRNLSFAMFAFENKNSTLEDIKPILKIESKIKTGNEIILPSHRN